MTITKSTARARIFFPKTTQHHPIFPAAVISGRRFSKKESQITILRCSYAAPGEKEIARADEPLQSLFQSKEVLVAVGGGSKKNGKVSAEPGQQVWLKPTFYFEDLLRKKGIIMHEISSEEISYYEYLTLYENLKRCWVHVYEPEIRKKISESV